jgi:peptidoglycan/LPS O-acetylase OafA/YrhL
MRPLPDRLASAGQLLAFAGIAAAITAQWSAPVGPCSALLIFCLASDTGVGARMLGKGWCVHLGAISYSIYLLHAPLLAAFGKLSAGWNGGVRTVLFLALLLAASELTFRLIELPGRRLPALLTGGTGAQRSALRVEGRSSR